MQSMRSKKTGIVQNQDGMIAIVVTSVLMMVISLLVLGFMRTIQNEQRQALDNQLSTQAFYAAESGVNLAKSKIDGALAADPNADVSKTGCTDSSPYTGTYPIDTGAGSTEAAITCLLVNPTPESQEFQNIGANAKSTRIAPDTGETISSLFFSWQSSSKGSAVSGACTSGTGLPAAWGCEQPILRVDLVPLAANLTQSGLQTDQLTVFLRPEAGSPGPTQLPYTTNAGGLILQTTCQNNTPAADSNYVCTAEVSTLPNTAGQYGFAVRMLSLYGSSNVSVYAKNSSSAKIKVKGQFVIDSTARAVDVIRRIQVRASAKAKETESWALQTDGAGQGICKQYKISANQVDTAVCGAL
jgi:Tfp pilus assembly protein PilX